MHLSGHFPWGYPWGAPQIPPREIGPFAAFSYMICLMQKIVGYNLK